MNFKDKEEGELSLDEVEIPVKIDPNGGYERSNTTKETFKRLSTFADAREDVVELRRDLSVKLYRPMGLHETGRLVSRLRYLSMTLGTTAKQQLSKAVKTAFLKVAEKKDRTMTAEERIKLSGNEKMIYEWLGKPRHTAGLWNGLTEEAKVEAIKEVSEMMEDHVWFHLNRLAYDVGEI